MYYGRYYFKEINFYGDQFWEKLVVFYETNLLISHIFAKNFYIQVFPLKIKNNFIN